MGAPVTHVIPDPVTGIDKPIGTAANPFVTSASDGAGGVAAALPAGRAAAASSVPVVLSAEDKLSLDLGKTGYSTAAAYTNATDRTPGTGILCVIATAGTATLRFGGIDIPFTLPVGPTVLPLAVTRTTLGTAVGNFYAIT